MSQISCGIGPLRKGQRHGTAEECLNAKQVRLYGKHKVDSKLLASHEASVKAKRKAKPKGESTKLPQRDIMMIKIAGIRGRMTKLKRSIEAEKDRTKKKALQSELASTKLELEQAIDSFNSKFN